MMRAARINLAVMGAWMGLAGIEHGIGEMLQGRIVPEGIMIQSWPEAAFFKSLAGEPAMTILPDVLLTGILAAFFSLVFSLWSVFFARHRYGGAGMMLLAIPMLLFGGGIFPPLLGFLIGSLALWMQHGRHKTPKTRLERLAGRCWPGLFAACCLAWLGLFPGVAVMGYFRGDVPVGVILGVMVAAFSLLGLSLYSSTRYDRLGCGTQEAPVEDGKVIS
jgi:hypothetical protein